MNFIDDNKGNPSYDHEKISKTMGTKVTDNKGRGERWQKM